jgi:hypothetical protein
LDFRFPIEITGAGNISFTMSLTSTGTVLSSGTLDVDGGTAGTQGYVRAAKGFTYTFADDATTEAVSLADAYEAVHRRRCSRHPVRRWHCGAQSLQRLTLATPQLT